MAPQFPAYESASTYNQISNNFPIHQSPNPKFQIEIAMVENSLSPLKSNLQITSQTTSAPQTNLAMALSSLSPDKETIAPSASSPPSTSLGLSISPVNKSLNKNKKRKTPDWVRVPLEDITHLFYPNNNEATPSTAPLHSSAPTERRVVVVKRRVLKPGEMTPRVSLRKEFR